VDSVPADIGELAVHDPYLGAYWGPRPETGAACAERLISCLRGLSETSPFLTSWRATAHSHSAALGKPLMGDRDIRLALIAGRNRRDTDHGVIDELGYSLGLWNGSEQAPISFAASCGARSPWVSNVFALRLPEPDLAPSKHLYDVDNMLAAMSVVVRAWEPDWAVVSSLAIDTGLEAEAGRPVAGWVTFVSKDTPLPSGLPVSVRQELPGLGSLFVSSPSFEEFASGLRQRVNRRVD
jgi:hypothetical protein